MNFVNVLLFSILMFAAILLGYNNIQEKIITTPNRKDTLKIGYADTKLIGKRVFPTILDSNHLEHIINEKVLLIFESENYYYVFLNRKDSSNLLSPSYWNELTLKYLNSVIENDGSNLSNFTLVDYSPEPFVIGLYSFLGDSIIIGNAHLTRSYIANNNPIDVRYFSTSNTLLKLNSLISVGLTINDVIVKLQIPIDLNIINSTRDFKIVLMRDSKLFDNLWYKKNNSDCSVDCSNAVVLSFSDKKLIQIQYIDFEYVYYLFTKKDVFTKDIHQH